MIKEKFQAILSFCDEEDLLAGAPNSIEVLESKMGVIRLPCGFERVFSILHPQFVMTKNTAPLELIHSHI